MSKRAPSRRQQGEAQAIADRLVDALHERGKTVHWLFAQLRGDKPAGRFLSYTTVRSYARGDTMPSLDMLREAARVLHMDYAHLVSGKGEPTAAPGGGGPTSASRLSTLVAKMNAMRDEARGKTRQEIPASQQAEFRALALEARAVGRDLADAKAKREAEASWDEEERHQVRIQAAFAAAFPAARDDQTLWEAAAGSWYFACRRFVPQPRANEVVEIGAAAQVAAARAVGQALAAPLAALRVSDRDLSPWRRGQYARLISAALETVLVGVPEFQYRPLYLSVRKPRGQTPRRSATRLRRDRTRRR